MTKPSHSLKYFIMLMAEKIDSKKIPLLLGKEVFKTLGG
jgi:hypothetical protein